MTVKLAPDTFLHPVVYTVPGDHGKPFEITFQARFRRLSTSQRKQLDQRMRCTWLKAQWRATTDAELRAVLEQHMAELGEAITPIDDAELARAVLAGWSMTDQDGHTVPDDPATVAAVMDQWEGIATAIARAYIEATNPAAAEENSARPSPTTSGLTAGQTA